MRKLKNTKRLISFALAFAMVLSLIPFSAFAADFVGSTFQTVSWRNTVEIDEDGTRNIWCQFDSANAFGWGAFQPESAACIKLVKAGKTEADAVNIGYQSGNAFINDVDGYARVRYSQYWMNLLGVGDIGLPADGDYIIVEGKFLSGDNAITVPKTYIKLTASGDNLIASSTAEQPEELKEKPIEVGSLDGDSSHTTQDGEFIWTTSDGTAVTDTWVNYFADSDDCVQLLKANTTTPVSIGVMDTSMTNESIILNRGGNTYCIRHNQNFMNCSGNSETTPLDVGDTLIVGGNFTSPSGTKIHITTTYIQKNEDGTFTFSTTAPSPATIEVGTMKVNSDNAALNNGGFYFTMDANELPYTDDWNTRYSPVNADVIKLVRDGETTSVGIAERAIFIKYGENAYYLDSGNSWFMNNAPLAAGDMLIVEGQFTDGTVIFNVSKSVIIVAADGSLTFATEIPAGPVQAGHMTTGTSNRNSNVVWFTTTGGAIPVSEKGYWATSTDCVKLIRDGADPVSIVAGTTERYILKNEGDSYMLETGSGWYLTQAIQTGDILIVEGNFTDGTNTIHIDRSVIIIENDTTVTIATEVPTTIPSGTLSSHANGMNYGDGIYFTMAETTAPSNEDWSALYLPVNAACVQVIRNGETFNVGNTAAGTIVKVSNDMYYLKTQAWMNSKAPIVPGDIVVLQGQFVQDKGNAVIKVEKTYISVNWDGTLTYSTEQPEAPVKPFSDTQSYTIGAWAGSFHRFSLKHFYDLRMAGINQIVGVSSYWQGSSDTERTANMNNLLDIAAMYGVTVVPTLDNSDTFTCWDGTFVPGYNTQHAAIAGFLIQDEPSSSDLDSFGTLKSAFDSKTAFAGKEFFVNLYPESTSNSNIGGDYDAYVEKLSSIPGVNILSTDIYPVNSNGKARTSFYHNLALLASKGKSLSYTYLTAAHKMTGFSYAQPDQNMLRWQMDVGLTFGAQSLNQYIYSSHDTNYNCIADATTGLITNSGLYNDVAAVDNDHLAWLGEYSTYTWKGVNYVNKNSNEMLSKMSGLVTDMSGYGISAIDSTQDILVGMFQNGTQNAYMLTNAGKTSTYALSEWNGFSMNDATVTLTLDRNVVALKVISKGVTTELQPNEDGSYTVPVSAYEGVFVIPVIGTVDQWNITLKDNLSVNFYLNLNAEEQVKVTVGTKETVYQASTLAKTEDGKYLLPVEMAAAQMMDEITIQVVGSDEKPTTYTIRQYANKILNGAYNEAIKQLVKDMLNYGAMAQVYFDYNATNLANAGIIGFGEADVTKATYETTIAEGAVEGIRYYGASLVYGNKVAVRLYFQVLSGSIDDYTFSTVLPNAEAGIEANVLTPVAKGEYYYIEFADIAPDNWSESVNLYVIKGEQNLHVQYSPLSYMVRMYSKATSGEALKNLLKAMYNYHLAAKAYTA